MIDILHSEFYKLVHNIVTKLPIIASFILAIIINVMSDNDAWKNQIDVMSIFLPLLPCILVGSIWASEYSDKTLLYMQISGKQKTQIFFSKTISSLMAVTTLFIAYVFGLVLSKPTTFLKGEHLTEMYLVPWILLLVHTEILILIAILCKSFSKTAMSTAILTLFYIFCYKLTTMYGNQNIFIRMIGENTFSGIYVLTYQCIKQSVLLYRCAVNVTIGIVGTILAFFVFIKTTVF